MKHPNYNLIVAHAENTNLIKFVKCGKDWMITQISEWDGEYFLCLPKHEDAVLHSLNGGDVEASWVGYKMQTVWTGDKNPEAIKYWKNTAWYMRHDCESRVKPELVERWIGVFPVDENHTRRTVTAIHCASIDELKESVYAPNGFDKWHFIPIMVNTNEL